MLVAYAAAVALLMGGWKRKIEDSIVGTCVLIASIIIVVILSMVIPNVGTLYRMRLAPWHVALGAGLCVAARMLAESKR